MEGGGSVLCMSIMSVPVLHLVINAEKMRVLCIHVAYATKD